MFVFLAIIGLEGTRDPSGFSTSCTKNVYTVENVEMFSKNVSNVVKA